MKKPRRARFRICELAVNKKSNLNFEKVSTQTHKLILAVLNKKSGTVKEIFHLMSDVHVNILTKSA